MAVNAIFKTNNLASIQSERNLYSDLIKEAIQIYGHDVYYVGEIITQFGLENRNEITFVVNKKRFQELDSQITLEDGTGTTGGSIQLEAGTIDQTTTSSRLETVTQSFITLSGTDSSSTNADDKIMLEDDNTSFILSEESGSEFYLINDSATTDADRPQEGDLIYTPILKKMFEISFVDHDDPFHQLDNNPVYKLRCKQYEYSSEVIDTGITEVDAVESDLSADAGQYQFTLEQSSTYNEGLEINDTVNTFGVLLEETDGDQIIMEDETTSAGENILLENAADSGDKSYLLQETYIVGDASTTSSDLDKSAQNELFDQLDDDVLDFSETNPFGDAGGT